MIKTAGLTSFCHLLRCFRFIISLLFITMASPTNSSWQILSLTVFILFCFTTLIESKLQVPFQDFATPAPAISKKIYYLTDYCEICEKFRPEFTRVPRPPEDEAPEASSKNETTPVSETSMENDDGIDASKPKDGEMPKKSEGEEKGSSPSPPSSSSQPPSTVGDVLEHKTLEKEESVPGKSANPGETDPNRSNNTGGITLNEEPSELKRVPRGASINNVEETKANPEITMLEYDRQSFNDSDLNSNGTWSWRKAFKRIKAKWIEKYANNTVRKVDNKFTATIKETKSPEGDQQKKFVLEFKKKIGNLTLLNADGEEVEEDVDLSPDDKDKPKVLVKRELKQIFLDPIKQPSIVIRKKRSTNQLNATGDNNEDLIVMSGEDSSMSITTTVLPNVVVGVDDEEENSPEKESKKNATYEKCRLLIRFKNVDNDTLISLSDNNQTEAITANLKNNDTETGDETLMTSTKTDTNQTETGSLENKTFADEERSTKAPEISKNLVESSTLSGKETKTIEESSLSDKEKALSISTKAPKISDDVAESLNADSNKKEKDSKKESTLVKSTIAPKISNDLPEAASENLMENKMDISKETSLNSPDKKTEASTLAPKASDEIVTVSTTSASTPVASHETEVPEEKAPIATTKNTDLGFMINVRKFVGSVVDAIEADFNKTQSKMEKNPFLKNLRIFTSDPGMTEFWNKGKKVDSKSKKDGPNRPKRSIKENQFIDMLDMEDIAKLLTQTDGADIDIVNEKWILLERKIFFDDPDDDDDEELIINLFFKPKEEEPDMKQKSSHERLSEKSLSKSEKKIRCPAGTFDCKSDGSLCVPNSLKCNGEDNCGNGHDEMRSVCGSSLNLFYVYNEDPSIMDSMDNLDSNTQGMFWFGIRVIFILSATCLFLYILLLLCRMCDRLRSDPGSAMFIIPKGNYISISGDTIERKQWPSSSKGSSKYGVGSKMDSHGSKIREYIYVNNNYGQPQGSTMVSTDVQPNQQKNRAKKWYNRLSSSTTSPDMTDDEYPPLYEDTVRQYGTKK